MGFDQRAGLGELTVVGLFELDRGMSFRAPWRRSWLNQWTQPKVASSRSSVVRRDRAGRRSPTLRKRLSAGRASSSVLASLVLASSPVRLLWAAWSWGSFRRNRTTHC